MRHADQASETKRGSILLLPLPRLLLSAALRKGLRRNESVWSTRFVGHPRPSASSWPSVDARCSLLSPLYLGLAPRLGNL